MVYKRHNQILMSQGLLNKLDISVVLITTDLVLIDYNDSAASLLGIDESCIGTTLPAVCPSIKQSLLSEWVSEAIEAEQCISRDIQTGDREWLELRIFADREDDDYKVILAFEDVSDRKLNELRFKDASSYSESIVQTVREPLLVLDSNLRVKDANRAFCKMFRVTEEETIGQYIYDLGNGQWNIPRLRILLEEILPNATQFNDFEVEYDFPTIGKKTMLLDARQLDWQSEHLRLILLAIEDITEQQSAIQKLEEAYERQRIIADTLQNALISDIDKYLQNYHVFATYRPSSTTAGVGGDFYDVVVISEGIYLIVVGDVSGKGLEAAVYTAMCKYMLRAYAQDYSSPSNILAQLNRTLASEMPEEMFVTIFCGLIEVTNHKLVYASGGHEPLLKYNRASGVEVLPAQGQAVGVFPKATYDDVEVQINPNDLLVVYTDGITEARNEGQMLGIEGLSKLLTEVGDLDEQHISSAIFDLAIETNGGALKDDAAVMLIRRQ